MTVDLSGVQPSWPVEARVLWADCAARAARHDALWRVPAPRGTDDLREQLGRLTGLAASELTVVAGVRAAALTYGRVCPRLLLERPTFRGLVPMLTAAGRIVEPLDLPDDLLGPPPAPGTLVLVTSPARNPDGRDLTREDCDRLDAWATSGVRVVVNATYLWFRPAAPRPRRAEVLISLHKLAGVGARLGVVTGERFFAEGVPELAAAGPPPGWQATWASFLASGGADLLMAANVVPAALAAQIFDEAAGSVIDSLTLAPSGPNRLLRLGDGLTENDVVNRLAERGFRVSPGSAFDSPEPAVRATFTGVSVDEARSFASVVSPGMRGLDIRSRRR